MILREYQERAINDLRASYQRGRRAPCLVLPTGGGKTVIASAIIRGAIARGKKVLFNAHRTELISQSVKKLAAAGVTDVRVIQAAKDIGSQTAPVSVASVPTLTGWEGRMPEADLCVFDEAHHVVAKTWKVIADNYSSSLLLGMSATPQRSDGSPLGDVFDDLVIGTTMPELVSLGHLVPCRIWAPPSGVLESGELAVSPLQAYQEHGNGEPAVVFCVSKKHAHAVSDEMNAAGIPCGVVHGSLASKERAQTLYDLRTGKLKAVANVYVLTEGWDEPCVSVCILARKPQHPGTYLQMVGRVLRPSPGKEFARLLDTAGASLEHGPPEMQRKYTLDGKGISKVDREAIRQCMSCGGVFLAGPDVCPSCGIELPKRPKKEPKVLGVGLVEQNGKAPVDQLIINLRAVAKRTRRDDAWIERARVAIGGVR